MSLAVKTPEVASQKPSVDNGFRREFPFIQVAGHNGFAADSNVANAIGSRIHNAHFHSWQRLADRVRAEWFQIVDRDRRTGFRESVSVGNGNPEIVKKLQRLRFSESAADNDGAEFSAKRFMDLFEQEAADAKAWQSLRQRLVQANKHIENFAFARRQRIETRLQSFLQVFQNERNETHISDFVLRKSFTHVFRTQCAQMHYRCATRERAEKTNHEINGMVGRQNTKVTNTWPERINRGKCDALLQIIFVRHHATLGAAARSGRVDNAGCVLPFARDEYGFAGSAKFFPALRAGEIDVCG